VPEVPWRLFNPTRQVLEDVIDDGRIFDTGVYLTPSRLAACQQRIVAAMVEAVAAALGLTSGPIHAEMRINRHGVWPLELAARSIGGRCAGALRFGNDVALEAMILRQLLGLPTAHLDRERCALVSPTSDCPIHYMDCSDYGLSVGSQWLCATQHRRGLPCPCDVRCVGWSQKIDATLHVWRQKECMQ